MANIRCAVAFYFARMHKCGIFDNSEEAKGLPEHHTLVSRERHSLKEVTVVEQPRSHTDKYDEVLTIHELCTYYKANLSAHPATIDSKNLSTNIATRPARQKHNTALEIVRAAPASRRNSRQNALSPLLIIDERSVHLRRNVTRRNSIDSNTLRRPLIAQRLGQLRNTALARCVRRNRQTTLETQERCNVDNGTSAAVGVWLTSKHVRADFAAEGEDCAEVDLEHFVPVVVGELVRGVAALDTAAVQENVDVVAVFEDLRDEGVD